MRFGIVGAGAVGGYFGARLAEAGNDVVFVTRTKESAARLREGLEIRSPLGDLRISPVQATDDPAEVGSVDVAIVAVKLKDTESAARAAAAMAGPSTTVVSLQNGVDKDDVLVEVVGRERVLGGVCYILAELLVPGVVVHTGTIRKIVVGELEGWGESRRVREIVATLSAAGIEAVGSEDVRRETWQKFVFLATIAAVTAASRETVGVLRTNPAARRLLREGMEEIVRVAAAEGVAIPEGFVDDRMRFIDGLPEGGRASMAQDLAKGRPLELEWLSGSVVRRGRKHSVPTPVHETLYGVLAPWASGRA